MKKTLSAILVVFMILSGLSLTSISAANYNVSDGILYSYSGSDKSFTVPTGVVYIADSAFEGNTTLESVNLGSVEIIGSKAFSGCKNLKTVTSGKVSHVGAKAFDGTPYYNNATANLILGSVLIKGVSTGNFTVPTSVTSLSAYCFAGNTGITSASLGSNVLEIGEGAFYKCTSLATLNVSSSVSNIGAFAFDGTKWLSSQTSEFVTLGNGILIKYNGSKTAISVPSTVLQIADGAFYENKTAKSVVLPEGVTSVGMRAFGNNSALESVNFPKSLVSIGKEAFLNCTSLKSVTVPGTVKLVGDSAFLGCTKITEAEYFSSAEIPNGLFAGCTSLKYAWIAGTAKSIGAYAFYNCSSLLEVSVPDSVKSIDTTAFSGAKKVTAYLNDGTFAYDRLELMGVNVSKMGDANLDSKINVVDATHMQKAAAKIISMNISEKLRGDTDYSGDINVKDVTNVQKIVAGII